MQSFVNREIANFMQFDNSDVVRDVREQLVKVLNEIFEQSQLCVCYRAVLDTVVDPL